MDGRSFVLNIINRLFDLFGIGDFMVDYIEVHIISNRPELDKFINMWNEVFVYGIDCTIKVLMLDYSEKKYVLNNGIKVEYIKQKTFPKTQFMNQSWYRNELLCYTEVGKPNTGKNDSGKIDTGRTYILFFDDWQRPEPHILLRHLEFLKLGYVVCGRRLECDKDGLNCKEDTRYVSVNVVRQCSSGGEFWCCNGSVSMDKILAINGFDNRYNGGSAGEDADFGIRVSRLGVGIFYNGNALSYHYNHDHLGGVCKYVCGYSHVTSEWKYIPEYGHLGKWENMDGGNKFEFWWEDGVKYYKCKICNGIGILDSVQVRDYNEKYHIVRCKNGLEQVREALKNVKS